MKPPRRGRRRGEQHDGNQTTLQPAAPQHQWLVRFISDLSEVPDAHDYADTHLVCARCVQRLIGKAILELHRRRPGAAKKTLVGYWRELTAELEVADRGEIQ